MQTLILSCDKTNARLFWTFSKVIREMACPTSFVIPPVHTMLEIIGSINHGYKDKQVTASVFADDNRVGWKTKAGFPSQVHNLIVIELSRAANSAPGASPYPPAITL